MHTKNIKQSRWGLYTLFLIVATMFVSCDNDDIVIGSVDEFPYQAANESYAFLRHVGSANTSLNIDVRENSSKNIFVELSKPSDKDVTVSISADFSLVDAYNRTNLTQYEAFPSSLFSIANSGNVSIAKWTNKSASISVNFTKDNTLEGNTYLLPLVVTSGANAQISSSGQVIYYVINVAAPIPSSAKDGWNGVGICYVEVMDIIRSVYQ